MNQHIKNEAIAIMRPKYLSVRFQMDELKDHLICLCNYEDLDQGEYERIHLKILQLEGEFRSINNAWGNLSASLEVISSL